MTEQLSLIERATRIAVLAHKEQVRKSDNSPYVVHPFMCAMKLKEYNFPDEVIAAALVHDVLEDTEFPADMLRKELGEEVFAIVKVVSENNVYEWEVVKQNYVDAVRNGPDTAKAVSIADKIHNMQSLLFSYEQEGGALWEKFNRGKEKKLWFEEQCLKMFKETWQHPLIEEYEKLVMQMRSLE